MMHAEVTFDSVAGTVLRVVSCIARVIKLAERLIQVIHPFGFRMCLIERFPNHGQEFMSLNRFRQEGSRASMEHTFFVRSSITP